MPGFKFIGIQLAMNSKDFKFLVLGAGAIGGITAAALKRNGFDVEIICKYDDYATLISTQGIDVQGVHGSYNVKIPAYATPAEVKGKKDIIIHATKAANLVEAAKAALPVLKDDGFFISMQNGICEDKLAEVTGKDRVIGCVTGWGATMESQGKMIMTSHGDFIIGYPDKEPDELLTCVADALSAVVPVRTTGNIMGHLYSKLIINSCITSLGAICGLYLGKMLSLLKIRRIFIEIIREAVTVADIAGIQIEKFGKKLDFHKFIEGNSVISDLKRHLMIRIIGFRYRRLKSSSLQSLERGKATEVDYFNGYIAELAGRYGVDVPVNRAITSIIHEIESGTRPVSLSNFDDSAFDNYGKRNH